MEVQNDWWRTLFQGLFVDTWLVAIGEGQSRAEAEFIARALKAEPGARLLDVPCGAGRITLELAAMGFQVTGVDLSQPMLAAGRQKAAQRNLSVEWHEREMRDLDWHDYFDGATCWGGSFGYLDDAGNAEFLQTLARSLKPGARLVLDACKIAELILPRYEERSWGRMGDVIFLEENNYDHVNSRYETEYTLIRGGVTETHRGSERIYTFKELSQLLNDCDLRQTAAYGSLGCEPFKWGSPTLIIVAEKRG